MNDKSEKTAQDGRAFGRISHLAAICHNLTVSAPESESDVQVLPFGTHETEAGSFTLDEQGIREIIADFSCRRTETVVDYEHQTLKGVEAPAAGWVTALVDRGPEGLWARVRWTARAVEYIRAREYRYLSPVFLTEDATGRVVRLVNLALTNQPAIDGMAPVAAKRTHETEVTEVTKEKEMKRIHSILGLGPEATEAEVFEAITALIAERDSLKAAVLPDELLSALGLTAGASLEEATGIAAALRRTYDETGDMASKLEEAAMRLRTIETESLVDGAMREGKVTPAQRGWALKYAGRDPEGFTAFVAKAPVVIHHTGVRQTGISTERARPTAIDELQREANRITGVSEAVYLKHHARAAGPGE